MFPEWVFHTGKPKLGAGVPKLPCVRIRNMRTDATDVLEDGIGSTVGAGVGWFIELLERSRAGRTLQPL